MQRLALSQLKTQPRRYVSLVLAILIGTAFLAASFLVGASSQATMTHSMGSAYANADLVVLPDDEAAIPDEGASEQDLPASMRLPQLAGTPAAPGPIGAVDGVAEAYAGTQEYVEIGPKGEGGMLLPMPQHTELTGVEAQAGRFPAWDADDEVALDAATAERLDVQVGDELRVGRPGGETVTARVVGLSAQTVNPLLSAMPQVWSGHGVREVVAAPAGGDGASSAAANELQIALAEGADAAQVRADVEKVLADESVSATVSTPDEAVRERVADMAGANVMGWVLGGFAVLALLVTGLVIANTFQVLVAQRTRESALLRTLGATAAQVRRGVLAEAAVVGLVGSVLGAGLAVGLTAGLIAAVRTMPESSTARFGMSWTGLGVAVAVGVLVTVLAALRPAIAATRVSPLQAMQPRQQVTADSRVGRLRLVVGFVLALGGGALMVAGALNQWPLPAIGGGALSFLGVLLLTGLFVPAAVKAASVLARPAGVPGRLAGLNAVRQRSRTAATASALLIGTTLVTLFLVGGRTAQDQLDTLLDEQYPVDLTVQAQEDADLPELVRQARDVAGVETVAAAWAVGETNDGMPVYAVEPEELRDVVGAVAAEDRDRLGAAGTVLSAQPSGEPVSVDVAGRAREFASVSAGSFGEAVYMTVADAEALGWSRDDAATPHDGTASEGGAATSQVMLALDPDVKGGDLRTLVDRVGEIDGLQADALGGGAPERSMYAQMVDMVMWIVVVLLAVSVLIALIGVANTLSLSTIERTRENSLLRALGLSRGGLRRMIAIEAVLIAAVAALLGVALGGFYGWAGSQLVLGGITEQMQAGALVPVSVPWVELGAVVLVAGLAGLTASLLPSRRATRLSPVAGMASM